MWSKLKDWDEIEIARSSHMWENMFPKMTQISQENTFARVSFLIKLKALGLKLY